MLFLFRSATSAFLRPGLRQGLVVLADQALCSGANFLAGLLVARACGKPEYGLYVLAFTFLNALTNVQAGLTGTPFTVLWPRHKADDERRRYLGATLAIHVAFSALVACGFLATAGFLRLVDAGGVPLSRVFVALSAALFFVVLRDFMRYVLLAQLRVWASLIMGTVANLATIAALAVAYRGGWLTPVSAYGILAICSGLPVLVALRAERNQIAWSGKDLLEFASANWQIGKWLIARAGAFFLSFPIFTWALTALRGPTEAGIYGACMLPISLLAPCSLAMARFLGPKTAHAAAEGPRRVRRLVYSAMLALGAPFAVLVAGTLFFAEEILSLLFDDKYAGAGPVVAVLAIQESITEICYPIDCGLTALGRTDVGFRGQALAAVLALGAGLPLVYAYGAMGAALGLLISRSGLRLYLWRHFARIAS